MHREQLQAESLDETAVQGLVPPYPSIMDSQGPLPTCENAAQHTSPLRWCSNWAHWFQINPNNGRTAGILFHDPFLEQGLTWQLMYSLMVQLHHTLHLVFLFVALTSTIIQLHFCYFSMIDCCYYSVSMSHSVLESINRLVYQQNMNGQQYGYLSLFEFVLKKKCLLVSAS